MSNALLVSGANSASGHPLMVVGPQVAYFTPQILMEEDVSHGARASTRSGAAFPGVNLYVQLGHGRDYAWSATSAGQDIIDTFAMSCASRTAAGHAAVDALPLPRPCLPIEVLDARRTPGRRTRPTTTPAGTETLQRASARSSASSPAAAPYDGKPVLFTMLRSTYFHEVDSARRLHRLQRARRRSATPQDFQRAASKIGYTFNWFYVDAKHIAYFNSGNNPVRAKRRRPGLPVRRAAHEWRGWDPDRQHRALHAVRRSTRRSIDQPYLTSWNNKPGARLRRRRRERVRLGLPLAAARATS